MSQFVWFAAVVLAAAYVVGWAATPQLAPTVLPDDAPVRVLHVGAAIKAAPVALLALVALAASRKHLPGRDHGTGRSHAALVALGLAMSAAGDVCLDLEVERPSLFLVGLACFLVAHVAYAAAFAQHGLSHARTLGAVCAALPVLSLGLLWPGIPEPMRPAVAVYSCVIAAMAYAAGSARLGAAAVRTIAGAALFVLSDSLLAGDRFGPPALRVPQPKLAVMLTYYAAQALLASGSVAATTHHDRTQRAE